MLDIPEVTSKLGKNGREEKCLATFNNLVIGTVWVPVQGELFNAFDKALNEKPDTETRSAHQDLFLIILERIIPAPYQCSSVVRIAY